MSDAHIEVTEGVGSSVDTRTEADNGNHRQVIVIGDPSVTDGIAPVDDVAGLKVTLGDDNAVTVGGTVAVSGSVEVTNDAGNPLPISGTVEIANDSGNAIPATGDVAHDAADSGNPIKIGGKALTAAASPVANNDRVNAWFDEYGRLVVSDRDIETGLTIGSTGLRDRLFAQRYTVLADSLADGLATFWTSSTGGGGSTTSSGGEGLLQTSASAAGSAQLTSTNIPYFPGQVGWMNSAVRFNDTGSAGNVRRIGVFTVSGTTPQDGFYYELDGTTLNAVVVKAGTPTAVASGSWTRVAEAPFTLDTNYHSFEIRYTANTVWFYVDNTLRHRVSGTTAAITATLNFAITLQSINSSGATNRLMAVRNIGVGRFGMPGQPVNETGLSAVSSLAVSGGTPHDSVDSGNPIKMGGVANSSAPAAVANGDRANAWLTRSGAVNIGANGTDVATGSGTATGAMRVELPTNGTGVVGISPSASGGLTMFRDPAVTNTAVAVKAAAGKVFSFNVYNPNASLAYLHFYNTAQGSTTVGTTTPVKSIALPSNANGTVALDSVSAMGISFSTAITIGASTTTTGGTAPGTALVVNVDYV